MRALFVSAGGDHGATALGMLHALNTDYTHVCGISAGALIAAALAHSDNTQECAQHMFQLLQDHAIATPWSSVGTIVNAVFALVFRHSLFKNNIPTLAQPYFDQPLRKTFQVGAYNATQGKYQTFDQSDPDIAHAVIASASVPGVFTPVHIRNDQFVDGAVAHVVPVQEILHYWEHNTGDIDILMCYPTHSLQQFLDCQMKQGTSLAKQMEKCTYEILWNTMQRDLQALERIAKPFRNVNVVDGRTVRLLQPNTPIYSSFVAPSKQAVVDMFEDGQRAARTQLRL